MFSDVKDIGLSANLFDESDLAAWYLDIAKLCSSASEEVCAITDHCSEVMDKSDESFTAGSQVPGKLFVKESTTKPVGVEEGRSTVISRQSSLTEEWFGNINNTHPDDISLDVIDDLFTGEFSFNPSDVDISANLDQPLRFETPTATQQSEEVKPLSTELSLPWQDAVVTGEVSCELSAVVASKQINWTLPSDSVVEDVIQSNPDCKLSISDDIKELAKHQETIEESSRSVRKRRRRPSSTSRYSQDDSDAESQSSDESDEDMKTFAQVFLTSGRKTRPYFWQYNAQSRGPKSRRLCSAIELEDSHVVPEFADPVFGSASEQVAWQHIGKARHGDGNDPQPDPRKLFAIGCRIWRLETEFRMVGMDTSDNRSSASRRKNQLASRVCRLKKKALHAANKIKLDGLKQEHSQLMEVIRSVVRELECYIETGHCSDTTLCSSLDQLIRKHLTFMIAGHTADYVNSELEKVASEIIAGKLSEVATL